MGRSEDFKEAAGGTPDPFNPKWDKDPNNFVKAVSVKGHKLMTEKVNGGQGAVCSCGASPSENGLKDVSSTGGHRWWHAVHRHLSAGLPAPSKWKPDGSPSFKW